MPATEINREGLDATVAAIRPAVRSSWSTCCVP